MTQLATWQPAVAGGARDGAAPGNRTSVGGRLAAVAAAWGVAAAVVLAAAAFTRIGPVVYVIDARHGVHAGDVVVAVGMFGLALLGTMAASRPRREERAADPDGFGAAVGHAPAPAGYRHRPGGAAWRAPGAEVVWAAPGGEVAGFRPPERGQWPAPAVRRGRHRPADPGAPAHRPAAPGGGRPSGLGGPHDRSYGHPSVPGGRARPHHRGHGHPSGPGNPHDPRHDRAPGPGNQVRRRPTPRAHLHRRPQPVARPGIPTIVLTRPGSPSVRKDRSAHGA